MAGSNEVARFLESLRDATRVLDAYTAKVREGSRASEQATRATVQAATGGGGALGGVAGLVGGAVEEAGIALAAKASTAALNEFSAVLSKIAQAAAPELNDALAALQNEKIAKAQTTKFVQDLNDQGVAPTDEFIRQDLAWRAARLNSQTVVAQEVERATGGTGSSLFLENLKAQQQARSHR